jgi:hypothetical protein
MNSLKRFAVWVLVLAHALLGLPLSAQAGLVTTQELIAVPTLTANSTRTQVLALLARDEVRVGLQSQGVDSAAATDRVQAMTDAEVEQLAARVAQTPAGGDVLGLVFTVFIVLLATDILGLTKVFPFTRSVR